MDIPVEFEKIGNILDAGIHAPSAGNLQDVKFVLVTDENVRESLAKACVEQYWISRAPVIIVVCTQPEKTKRFYGEKGESFSVQNGAAAVQNMLIAAHAQGLASCWVGAFEAEHVRRTLKIPVDAIIVAILPFGYADEKVPIPIRMPMENVVFLGAWGNRIKDIASYMEWYGEHVLRAVQAGKKAIKKFAEKMQK